MQSFCNVSHTFFVHMYITQIPFLVRVETYKHLFGLWLPYAPAYCMESSRQLKVVLASYWESPRFRVLSLAEFIRLTSMTSSQLEQSGYCCSISHPQPTGFVVARLCSFVLVRAVWEKHTIRQFSLCYPKHWKSTHTPWLVTKTRSSSVD